MNQTKTAKRKARSSSLTPPSSILNPHPLRSAGDINRTPPFGSGSLLLEQAREVPLKTVCNLFDYGMDGSLVTAWEEWTALAITSSEENMYSEGSARGRLVRFGGYFKQLIAAWLQWYVRITPETLRPPMVLPKIASVSCVPPPADEPEAVIAGFTRLYTRQESLSELWSVLDAVVANPAARQIVRTNLLSCYEALACITEATYALSPAPESRAGRGS